MATGQLAQRYNPLQLLGEGAMGKVWLAEDTLEKRSVALKQISRAPEGAEKSTLQLKQEFRLMSLLRHPN
ncbi:MAG TPA: serine/threonine protein kinase, partial [Oscillatoriaceae cyanobacterium]